MVLPLLHVHAQRVNKNYSGDVSVVAACISYNHNSSNVTLRAIKAINSIIIECEEGTSYKQLICIVAKCPEVARLHCLPAIYPGIMQSHFYVSTCLQCIHMHSCQVCE